MILIHKTPQQVRGDSYREPFIYIFNNANRITGSITSNRVPRFNRGIQDKAIDFGTMTTLPASIDVTYDELCFFAKKASEVTDRYDLEWQTTEKYILRIMHDSR